MEAWRSYLTEISTGRTEKIESQEDPYLTQNENDMLFVKKTLTAAQIITLGSTPIDIIGAPGVGKAIEVISASARLNFNSIAFDTAADLFLGHPSLATPQSTYQVIWGSFLQSASTLFMLPVIGGTTLTNLKENDPISARARTPNGTIGNSTIDIYVFYQIIAL